MHLCGQYISGPVLLTTVNICSSILLCCFDSIGALCSSVDEEGVAKIYEKGEEPSKEPSARLRLVSFVPLLSTSHKGKQK